jgi:1-acyl-sn-glycerol-3-phosphate acyltransferase
MAYLQSLRIWISTSLLVLMWVPVMGVVWMFDHPPLRLRTGRWFRRLGRLVARQSRGWRLHVTGLHHVDPSRAFVVVSNHQSLTDIPVLAHLPLDTKWLAKAELFRMPVFGWLLRMAGDIPVERGDRRKSARAALQAARVLNSGCSVVFFPEGQRSAGGTLGPFQEGPFGLAIREQAPVLPVVVEGTRGILPKRSMLFKTTQDIYLSVLAPVSTTGLKAGESSHLRDRIHKQIGEELARLRSPLSR